MKVRDAITQLSALPQDHDLMDEYGESRITQFYLQGDGENGPYVAYDSEDVED